MNTKASVSVLVPLPRPTLRDSLNVQIYSYNTDTDTPPFLQTSSTFTEIQTPVIRSPTLIRKGLITFKELSE